jgi:hypothetical protein
VSELLNSRAENSFHGFFTSAERVSPAGVLHP